MYLYVPNSLRPDPAILVAAHECAENGPAFYETTGFSTLADEYGFIVIYPSASQPGGCWDTSSHGPRPRVQIWHGTADTHVLYVNFGQEINQWTNVLGLIRSPPGPGPTTGRTRTTSKSRRTASRAQATTCLRRAWRRT
jgi:hypothetical protein